VIDHVGFAVTDFARSVAFYQAALAPLSITLLRSVSPEETGNGAHAGFGADRQPFFWLSDHGVTATGVHVAFRAASREHVDRFYAAALEAGGRDNGAPGLRPHYHANYYGAFVLDPDGNNLEAVCHQPL
jgi:catechol 2,3-dioxygenase-like lactoylglutathione lyase family enzyme